MLQISTHTSRQLEAQATKFLVAHGASPDGRSLDTFDRRQATFERRLAFAAVRGAADFLVAEEE